MKIPLAIEILPYMVAFSAHTSILSKARIIFLQLLEDFIAKCYSILRVLLVYEMTWDWPATFSNQSCFDCLEGKIPKTGFLVHYEPCGAF